MKPRRFILLLDPTRFSEEREAINTIRATARGEGADLVRALMLVGYQEIRDADAGHSDTRGEGEGLHGSR